MSKETLILKIVTNSKEKTLQMIVPIMGCEVFELKDIFTEDYAIANGNWEHLKKKGK